MCSAKGATRKPAVAAQAAGDGSRVAWIGGTGFGFEIKNEDDAELARRVMEFDALNQAQPHPPCEKDCVHLSLALAARRETDPRADGGGGARCA